MSRLLLTLELIFGSPTTKRDFLAYLKDDETLVFNVDDVIIFKIPEWRCIYYTHIHDSVAFRISYDHFCNAEKIESVPRIIQNRLEDISELPTMLKDCNVISTDIGPFIQDSAEDIIEYPLIPKKFD